MSKPLDVESSVVRPDIFEFHDYREFLKAWFGYRRQLDPNFSVRAIARRSKIGSSYIPMVLNGQRSLKTRMLERLAPNLGLRESEIAYFRLLMSVVDTELPEERFQALKRLKSFRNYENLNPSDVEVYHYLTKWYYVAIRELANTSEFKDDPAWIQTRLSNRISIPEIQEALDFLLENGYLVRDKEGRLERRDKQLNCSDGVYRIALGQFHKDMFNLAGNSFEITKRKNRKISAYTLTVSPDRWGKVKKLIENTQKEIAKLAFYPEKPESGEVYHVSLCAFPLTKEEEK